jgi:hypothetical protein
VTQTYDQSAEVIAAFAPSDVVDAIGALMDGTGRDFLDMCQLLVPAGGSLASLGADDSFLSLSAYVDAVSHLRVVLRPDDDLPKRVRAAYVGDRRVV